MHTVIVYSQTASHILIIHLLQQLLLGHFSWNAVRFPLIYRFYLEVSTIYLTVIDEYCHYAN